jgi:putative acetyltransferase
VTLVREAMPQDLDTIKSIYLDAFDDAEKARVSKLAADLLCLGDHSEAFSLVAERECRLIGHIGLSLVRFKSKTAIKAYILAPLAVKPDAQKQGVGSLLVECAIDRLTEQRVDLLFVYGDPKYYGRFGFNTDTALNFIPPYDLEYPFGWMARVLNEIDVSIQTPLKLTSVVPLNDPALW